MTDYTDAPCRTQDPEMWFSPPGPARVAALRTCLGDEATGTPACHLREACLEDALTIESLGDTQYLAGIYGGLSPNQRAKLLVPKCQRCQVAARRPLNRYCDPCAVEARKDTRKRFERAS